MSEDFKVPDVWRRTSRYLPQGFRITAADERTGHWRGGPASHDGATCYTCGRVLRLVWDFDLSDPALPDLLRDSHPNLTRLPLYFCFDCPKATAYRVVSDSDVLVLKPNSDSGDESLYRNVPAELERAPIQIAPIPSDVDEITSLAIEEGEQELTDADWARLQAFFGVEESPLWEYAVSQFGGLPMFLQGEMESGCPDDRNCPSWHVQDASECANDLLMKSLATVEEDPGLGIEWIYAPLAYEICWVCGAIQATFQCD